MNYKIHKDTLRASLVYGEGIENYMNDAPVDIGPESNPGSTRHSGRRQGPARRRASWRSTTAPGTTG